MMMNALQDVGTHQACMHCFSCPYMRYDPVHGTFVYMLLTWEALFEECDAAGDLWRRRGGAGKVLVAAQRDNLGGNLWPHISNH